MKYRSSAWTWPSRFFSFTAQIGIVLAELQFERCQMSTIRTLGRHWAYSMQGPSNVSDLPGPVVQSVGFTPYPAQSWVKINRKAN